jgi:hypothetical protein
MKQSTIAPEGVTDQGRELESRNAGQQKGDDAADTPLPHEERVAKPCFVA